MSRNASRVISMNACTSSVRQMVLLSITLLLACRPAATILRAQAPKEIPKEIEDALKAKYLGKVFTLREFQAGNWLRYSGHGHLIRTGDTGPWTLDALVELKKISMRSDGLELRANRVYYLYDQGSKTRTYARTDSELKITINVRPLTPSVDVLQEAMSKIFLISEEQLTDFLPDYWKAFFQYWQRPSADAGKEYCSRVKSADINGGGDITFPVLKRKVEPPFSKEARSLGLYRYHAKVRVDMVVQKDGTVRDIELEEPIGLGLDENAVNAVQQWKFQPGMRNGEPVDICTAVEVTFSYGLTQGRSRPISVSASKGSN